MSEFLEALKSTCPQTCIAQKCVRSGCNVSLKDAPSPSILIDLDCDDLQISKSDRRCDFLFASDSIFARKLVVLLELKRGRATISKIAAQLQGGANFTNDFIPKNHEVAFRPVAVYGGKLHRSERDNLKKPQHRILFRGSKYEIRLIRCGSPLREKLA